MCSSTFDEANANGLTIKYVIETHLHPDSGHRELGGEDGR